MKKLLLIALLSFTLASCTDTEYLENLDKSKVTIRLYTMGGTLEKDYILPTKYIKSLTIMQRGGGFFSDGRSVLQYFKPKNSWSGKYWVLESNIYQFEIINTEAR